MCSSEEAESLPAGFQHWLQVVNEISESANVP